MGEFSPTLRTLLCPACGAPADVQRDGGTVKCTYCGVTNEVLGRPTLEPSVTDRESEDGIRHAIGERPSDLPWLQWPPELRTRLGGRTSREKLPIVREAWLATYRKLRERYDAELACELYVLSMGMQSVALQLNELRCVRGALESALESTRSENQRQALCAQLGLDAAIAGDREAAEWWIARVHPRSMELEDIATGVTIARARLALDAGHPHRVLEILGQKRGAVSLSPSSDLFASLLRVAAFERLRHRAAARAELLDAAVQYGGRCVDRVRRAHGLGATTVQAQNRAAAAKIFMMSTAAGVVVGLGTLLAANGAMLAAGSGVVTASLCVLVLVAVARVGTRERAPMGYE